MQVFAAISDSPDFELRGEDGCANKTKQIFSGGTDYMPLLLALIVQRHHHALTN